MTQGIPLDDHKPTLHQRRWTETCKAALRQTYPTSMPVREIAEKLNRSTGAVRSKARAEHLRRPLIRAQSHAPSNLIIVGAKLQLSIDTAVPTVNAESSQETTSQTHVTPDQSAFNEATSQHPMETAVSTANVGPVQRTEPLSHGTQDQLMMSQLTPHLPIRKSVSSVEAKRLHQTVAGGTRTRWFTDVTERLERLWFSNIDAKLIATLLGEGFTDKAVWSKAKRLGLPARHGTCIINDVAVGHHIEAIADAVPSQITHGGKKLKRRRCKMTGVWFWSGHNHVSDEVKATKFWQNQASHAGAFEASVACW